NLLEYITGQEATEICAELTTFVEGRRLDDDGNVLVRLSGGARGVLYASQVCVGEENNLNIRIYGDRGGLKWEQQSPNSLVVTSLEGRDEIVRAGVNNSLSQAAMFGTRLPGGHPEGFIGAFANIYRAFAESIRSGQPGDHPTVHDGVRGMAFLAALVENSQGDAKWTTINIPRQSL
ncbi:MAG TPA: Gfo/Idh/MocA family oxidoreductase, partial [Pseudomonadales bacterium]|nr:Gfo/Idh/MocA family oxidoreductase [Pseudomonadales bacterium]